MPKEKRSISTAWCIEKGRFGDGSDYTAVIRSGRELCAVKVKGSEWELWARSVSSGALSLISEHPSRKDAEKAMFLWLVDSVLS
ncbi:MAG: hypothetical protein ACE5KO_06660 [Candidatus Bathyarchaeia archaeon]